MKRLEQTRAKLEATSDPDAAIEVLSELAQIARRTSRPPSHRRSARPMLGPDELRAAVEEHIATLELSPELGGLEEAVRYALAGGGKRIRPVLCLATAEAARQGRSGCRPRRRSSSSLLSLVHDDLPALDDDEERRGRPTAHVQFGEGPAILAGDALLAEAFRHMTDARPELAQELSGATLGMIGGQYSTSTAAAPAATSSTG